MAKFKPYKILSSKLSSLAKKEGQLIITTDDKKIYLDESSTNRICIGIYADEVLSKTNTASYTPTANYHPATKKYVDDAIAAITDFEGSAF